MTPSDDVLRRFLGTLEERIMRDVWAHGPSSVGQVLERLNEQRRRDLVYNTVMVTLSRLHDKGFLDRHRDGRAYVYHGTDRDTFLRERAAEETRRLIDELGHIGVAGILDGLDARPDGLARLRRTG